MAIPGNGSNSARTSRAAKHASSSSSPTRVGFLGFPPTGMTPPHGGGKQSASPTRAQLIEAAEEPACLLTAGSSPEGRRPPPPPPPPAAATNQGFRRVGLTMPMTDASPLSATLEASTVSEGQAIDTSVADETLPAGSDMSWNPFACNDERDELDLTPTPWDDVDSCRGQDEGGVVGDDVRAFGSAGDAATLSENGSERGGADVGHCVGGEERQQVMRSAECQDVVDVCPFEDDDDDCDDANVSKALSFDHIPIAKTPTGEPFTREVPCFAINRTSQSRKVTQKCIIYTRSTVPRHK